MTTEQYDGIAELAPAKLREHLGELHSKVLEAAGEALSATQDTDDGGKPKVRISLAVVIDLSQSPPSWHTEGKVGVTYKVKSDEEQCEETPELMPDMGKSKRKKVDESIAALGSLPGIESVSIQVGDNPPVTISKPKTPIKRVTNITPFQ